MKKLNTLFVLVVLMLLSCDVEQADTISDAPVDNVLAKTSSEEMYVIDFEEFNTGDIVSTVVSPGCSGRISVFGTNPNFPGQNVAMVFDSENPTGEDYDLGTPNSLFGGPGISADGDQPSNDIFLGKVLILSEDLNSSDPDDSFVDGSKYDIDFSNVGTGVVTLHSFDMLDLDPPSLSPTVVNLYDASDALIFTKEIIPGEDNSKQLVDLESTPDVARMELLLNNSGAIDNLKFSCEEEETEFKCETMFAKGNDNAMCFIEDGFNRWGWTNGPLSGGEYSFDLYAGAGQCDISKGTLVGTVTVAYDENTGEAEVTYTLDAGYTMRETHLYVGNDPYPKKRNKYTVAPGQFPYKHDLEDATSDSYTVTGLSGEIYVIAHGVVCGEMQVDD
ncbi:hypothetical protein [Leptobacterium sp. I13]|uniref:hypothetical protein n=1 Tax=Leptobacterium meishanense TaxID=3128904 RepID=UPI0030EF7DC3